MFWFASSWLGLGRFVLSCFSVCLARELVRALGALGPVISKDFVYISKIFKDDRELTPEEMSTMVEVRAEGCGAPCFGLYSSSKLVLRFCFAPTKGVQERRPCYSPSKIGKGPLSTFLRE